MESHRVCSPREVSYKDLKQFTNGFSENNFIGNTMFGKLYRGTIPNGWSEMEAQEVTVKIWYDRKVYKVTNSEEKILRVKEEVHLLQEDKFNSHPNLPRLIGYCYENECVGVVYDLKPLNTVSNLIFNDCFTWMQRVKVAVQLACLVEFLHNEKHNSLGFLVRNIGPTHILLDKEFCPKYIDFGMLSGGLLPDKRHIRTEKQFGCYGYSDPMLSYPGSWRPQSDIFAFACVLISLFCKRVFEEKDDLNLSKGFPFTDLPDWAYESFTPKYESYQKRFKFPESQCSLVHESFQGDNGFYNSDAIKMTKIMIQCIEEIFFVRPRMKEVVDSLLELNVVQEFPDELGAKHRLPGRRKSFRISNQVNALKRIKH